jgi:hypothetical protein
VTVTETQFVETEALIALMRDEPDEAQQIIDEMMPGERHALAAAATELGRRADDRYRCPGCGDWIERHEPRESVGLGGRNLQDWHPACRNGGQ